MTNSKRRKNDEIQMALAQEAKLEAREINR
jgi:hypothetical protein